jgi:uncharacterized protein YdaU (DUF1376 family)
MLNSYPWYIADWRESETRRKLSLAERGLYREFLDYCYAEGSLPATGKLLGSIAGTTGKQLRYNLDAVLRLFDLKETPTGPRYFHRKVDDVRPKLLSYHKQKAHAGALSGQARRERALAVRSEDSGTNDEPPPTTTTAPAINPIVPLAPDGAVLDFAAQKAWLREAGWTGIKKASAELIARIWDVPHKSVAESPNLESLYMIRERLGWFDEFWGEYRRVRGEDEKSARIKYFEKVPTYGLHESIVQAVIAQTPTFLRNEKKFRPLAATWLHKERWNDTAELPLETE